MTIVALGDSTTAGTPAFRSPVEDPAHPDNLSGTPDGLHPDVNGYRAMGEALTQVLEWHFASSPESGNP